MDSGAYKSLVEDIVSRFRGTIIFDYPFELSEKSLTALARFLKNVIASADGGGGPLSAPALICKSSSDRFSPLFYIVHINLINRLENRSSNPSYLKTGRLLFKEFVNSAPQESDMEGTDEDVSGLAMSCFLTEAVMASGWVPNGKEGDGKYAAHRFMESIHRNRIHLNEDNCPLICGYLWGAWLLARNTEGINEKGPSS